jgi:hypothetical protein
LIVETGEAATSQQFSVGLPCQRINRTKSPKSFLILLDILMNIIQKFKSKGKSLYFRSKKI